MNLSIFTKFDFLSASNKPNADSGVGGSAGAGTLTQSARRVFQRDAVLSGIQPSAELAVADFASFRLFAVDVNRPALIVGD